MNASSKAGLYLTLVELIGDTSIKRYAATNNTTFLGIGVSAYMGLVYILQHFLRTESLAITNGYWDSFSNILTSVAAIAMGEKLTNYQLAGLFMISGGVYLL